jgi:hypothetical protein
MPGVSADYFSGLRSQTSVSTADKEPMGSITYGNAGLINSIGSVLPKEFKMNRDGGSRVGVGGSK